MQKSKCMHVQIINYSTYLDEEGKYRNDSFHFPDDLIPFVCQRDNCPNAGNAEAGKVCYDHRISIAFAVESPPPLYLCIECANEICREYPKQKFNDILHPMQPVSMVCESKVSKIGFSQTLPPIQSITFQSQNCKGIKDKGQKEPEDRSAFSICFSSECTSFNGNHPIRYCQSCHNHRHSKKKKYNDPDRDNDGSNHIYHTALPHISQLDSQAQTYMVQAIVRQVLIFPVSRLSCLRRSSN